MRTEPLQPLGFKQGIVMLLMASMLVFIAAIRPGRTPERLSPGPRCVQGVYRNSQGNLVCGRNRLSLRGRKALWAGTKLNLNEASADALTVVPGIGAILSERIVADRKSRGPFKTLDAVTRVKGVGTKLRLRMERYVEVRNR